MLIYQWINHEKDRFYQITVKQNGLNGLVLNYCWGSNTSNRGSTKNIFLCSEEEATKEINKMIKRRKSRGYELITPLIH